MLEPAPVPPARHPVSTTRSRTSWGVEIGGFRLAVTRTREVDASAAAGPVRAPAPRTGWPIALGAFAGVSALSLLVVGANAAPRLATGRYVLSVEVPAPAARPIARPVARKAALAAPSPRPAPAAAALTDDGVGAEDNAYIARALTSGAFQQWEDALGQRRFLTAGPPRAEGGRTCRDLALLVRLHDGGSRVRSFQRCTTEPVSDAEPSAPVTTTDAEES